MEQTIYEVRNFEGGKLLPPAIKDFFWGDRELILACEIKNNIPATRELAIKNGNYSQLITYKIRASYTFLENLELESNEEWNYSLSSICEPENEVSTEYFSGWENLLDDHDNAYNSIYL